MSFDDIETTWRSPHNRPSPDDVALEKAELVRRLRGRYRAFLLTVGAGVTALLGCGAALVRYKMQGGALDLDREWGSLLFFALPLLGAAVLLHHYRRHRARHADYNLSISAGLRAALDENRLERTRIKIIAGLYGVMVLVFPVIVSQLVAVGKARPREVHSMLVLFGALVVVVSLALAYHYRRRLLPRKRELEALLRAYEGDAT
jgi:hypothetical protein